MLEYIEKQLKGCAVANLKNYDPVNHVFHIPKYTKPKYDIGGCYLVKLDGHIINNDTSVLATNWNNGTSPKYEYLKIYVSKAVGKTIYVDGLAYDFVNKVDMTDMWTGWLDTEYLTQLAQF